MADKWDEMGGSYFLLQVYLLVWFFKERRSEAQVQKEEGNDFFKKQEYELAIKSYSRALKLCPKDFVKDRAILFSNRAACRMKKVSTDENHRCNCKLFLLIFIHSFRILFTRLFCPRGFFPTLLHLQSVSLCVELAQTQLC